MNAINSNRKQLVYGIGINDANYSIRPVTNRKKTMCPFYSKWSNMLKRCYSKKYQSKKPTYIGCIVAKEWHSFMTFRTWMIKQNWRGNEIDKDILKLGNKIYSPETCTFVPKKINMLLNINYNARGEFPLGVLWIDSCCRFKAQITINGKNKFLGHFKTESEASMAYKKAKSEYIRKSAFEQSDYFIAKALISHADSYSRKRNPN